MLQRTQRLPKVAAGGLGLLVLTTVAMPRAAAADEVLEWSMIGFQATAAGGQLALVESRTMAMLHLAVHDALNTIDRRYEAYLYEGKTGVPGHHVASILYGTLLRNAQGFLGSAACGAGSQAQRHSSSRLPHADHAAEPRR